MKEDMIKVGTITTTHGLKGEVKVIGDNECFSTSFKDDLYLDTNPVTIVHIKSVKFQSGKLIIGFKEFNDINQVECFRNVGIYAHRDSLNDLEDDEVYLSDLIGMDVYNEKDELIGVVKDYVEYPQCYYLEVVKDGKKHLIPFIDEFIVDVTDVIIIHEMEGLLC